MRAGRSKAESARKEVSTRRWRERAVKQGWAANMKLEDGDKTEDVGPRVRRGQVNILHASEGQQPFTKRRKCPTTRRFHPAEPAACLLEFLLEGVRSSSSRNIQFNQYKIYTMAVKPGWYKLVRILPL
jgi:hypothetical protein